MARRQKSAGLVAGRRGSHHPKPGGFRRAADGSFCRAVWIELRRAQGARAYRRRQAAPGNGRYFGRLRPPLPEFTLFGGMMVNRLDIPHLRKFGRSFRSTLRSMRLVSQYALQRLRARRGTTLHLGNALAARLYASLLARNVDIWFGATVEHLLTEGDVIRGVRVVDRSGSRPIVARKGVVLATGGFSHDAGLRARFFPGAAGAVSAAAPGGSGDGLH